MKKPRFTNLASKNRDIIIVFIYLLYGVILDYALQVVARVYYYEGFVYFNNPTRNILSYSLTIFISYMGSRFVTNGISRLFFIGIFCLVIEPGIIYFMRSDTEYWKVSLLCGAYIWLLLFYSVLNRIPAKVNCPNNKTIFYGIILCVSAITYGLAIYDLGFRLALDFSNVYDIRDHFTKSSHFPLGYLVFWQGHIINPLLFYYVMKKNRYLLVGIIIALQFYLFSVTGLKTMVFSLVFSYFVTRYSKSLKVLVPLALSFIVLLSWGIYLYHGNVWFLALFVERSLFIPAQITYQYFDFFHNNPLVYLSDSILKYIFDYPYLLSVPLTIGIRYYDGASCNAGIFGNAYMNFGIPGVFLFSSILCFILSIFDRIAISKGVNASLIMASVAMTLISIINSGLHTVMLTHGMFLALVLAFFIPANLK